MNIVHDERIEEAIPATIAEVERALARLLRVRTRRGSEGRFEQIPEYPEEAWSEAIINALTHRSYALLGDHIRVRIFDDRMEIESPGRLPGLVRLDNIRTTRYSPNPRIARVLVELGEVRELGEGIDRIYEAMSDLGLPPPEFRQEAGTVVVTLYNLWEERQNEWEARRRREVVDLVPRELLPVFELLERHDRTTVGAVAESLRISRPTARRYLVQLGDLGIAVHITSGP